MSFVSTLITLITLIHGYQSFGDGDYHVRVCEGHTNQFTCEGGTFTVVHCWYGSPSTSDPGYKQCPHGANGICELRVGNCKNYFGQQCNGKSSCSVSPNNNNMGGDPCGGIYKFAAIHLRCTVPNRCADAATRCNDNNECTIDSCDENTGQCINAAKPCDDGDACTEDSCALGACVNTQIECSDGDYCNGEEYCENGQCKDAVDAVKCPSNFACNSKKKQCVRNCNLFAIDGYLNDCSIRFADSQAVVAGLQISEEQCIDDIDNIEDSVNGLSTDILSINAAIAAIEAKIGTSVQENPGTIYEQHESQDVDIQAIGSKLDAVKTQLEGDINTRVNTLETEIKNYIKSIKDSTDKRVKTVETGLAGLQALVGGFAPDDADIDAEEDKEVAKDSSTVPINGFMQLQYKDVLILFLLAVNMMTMIGLLVWCCASKAKHKYRPINYNSETDQEISPLNK